MPSLLTLIITVLSAIGVLTFASPLIGNDVLPANAAVEARDEWQPSASTLTCLYMTTETDWAGEGINLCEVGGTCGGKLPDGLAANVSSAGPEAGITCFLYSEQNCAGDSSAPLVNPGYGDLKSIKFDKKAQSWKCYKWCGWMGTSSASSTATASSSASASTTATTAPGLPSVSSSSSAITTTSSSSSSTQAQIFETSMTTIVFTHTYADGSTTVVSSPLAIPVPVTNPEPEDAGGAASITTTIGQTLNAPAPFTTTSAGMVITTTLSADSSTSPEAGLSITTTQAAASPVTTLTSERVTLAVPTETSEGVTIPVPSVSSPASTSSSSSAAAEPSEGWTSLVTLTGVDATLTVTATGGPAASPTN